MNPPAASISPRRDEPVRKRGRTGRIALLALFALAAGLRLPAGAEERITPERVRAINMARTYAVRLNGGLAAYRPARCMFATAARSNPCILRDDENGILFRFEGGVPAWEQTDTPPILETEILIAPDGRSIRKLIYNGPPR
jgi:hypothetical protein